MKLDFLSVSLWVIMRFLVLRQGITLQPCEAEAGELEVSQGYPQLRVRVQPLLQETLSEKKKQMLQAAGTWPRPPIL